MMSDDLKWAENLGKAAGGVNAVMRRKDGEIAALTEQVEELREALASLTMAVRAFQVDDSDGGNPYFAPSPKRGRALLSIWENAMEVLAKPVSDPEETT